MVRFKWQAVLAVLSALTQAVTADDAASQPAKSGPAEHAAVAKSLQASLVRVEYTLQYDKGDAPRCSNPNVSALDRTVIQERPEEIPGYILSPTKVLTLDVAIHPRFVKGIAVRLGDDVVDATISSYARDCPGVFLELAKPLKNAKPLAFITGSKGPLLSVDYFLYNGEWTVRTAPMISYGVSDPKHQYVLMPQGCLIVTEKGEPVGVPFDSEAPVDNSWQGSPEKWPMISAAEMAKYVKILEEKCDQGILRVALSFRSPRKDAAAPSRYGRDEGEEAGTERNVLGLLLDEKTVALMVDLKRNVTARLEGIKVYPAKGDPVTAKFDGTLTDYGCLLAKLDKPLAGAPAILAEPLAPLRRMMLLGAEIDLQGEKKVCYYSHNRINSFMQGRRREIYPTAAGVNQILFDLSGRLVAMPMALRAKPGLEGADDSFMLVPIANLSKAVSNLAANIDKSNVPLTEDEENRVAWTGMVLQPLDRELARINDVSQQTQDGATGALVSYVYPDSPADKAGIKQGFVLLRLHFKDQPKPLEVRVEGDRNGGRQVRWDLWHTMPEEWFDRIPTPWPAAEDMLCHTLTEMGYGKQYTADFFSGGKVVPKDFTIEQGPANYESAARFKWTETGLTVRDLTYELRRYFQKKDDDPGVIISKIEAGGKAAVAGIKPYEIITHIDGSPVANIKDFQKLIKKEGEIKLSVSNPFKGRQAKIILSGPTTAASGPASRPAPMLTGD